MGSRIMSNVLVRRCFGLGRLPNHLRKDARRALSSASPSSDDLVLSSIDEDAGIAMLTMNRPPANSLSLEMNEAICASIKSVEANPKIQSVILASSNAKIFSAGLDVSELVAPDANRLPAFWNSLQQVYIDLYGSRLATVACIQGHAPAAGCFLAMACDYRVMSAGNANHIPTIGLNETQLGIAAPPWMGQLLVRTIGYRQAELALALGTLFPPDKALSVGLVDVVVPEEESESSGGDGLLNKDQASNKLFQKAYAQARLFAKIPPPARVASKLLTRDEHIKDMIAKRDADTAHFCGFVTHKVVQHSLTAYVEALKKKSKKK